MLLAIFIASAASSQNRLEVTIRDASTKEVLPGATGFIGELKIGAGADAKGNLVFENIPNGTYSITFSYLGYQQHKTKITFPLTDTSSTVNIELAPESHEMEEIIISSTRTSRSIDDTPTRVETISLEEINEKTNMRPSNVSMLLHESTGIQVQQTSATSGNASIRIQGLDGRYTQLLKDGYPNFGNFASGLSILEIPPLDLKQVEVIKGPASTLYGGGAIAGVINFISKTPESSPENRLLFNQSHVGQTNLGFFSSSRGERLGYTLLTTGNLQRPYDVDEDDFTELPKTKDFTIHPRLFFYTGKQSTLVVSNSLTMGSRIGGDINVINNGPDATHTYTEENETLRNITAIEFTSNPNSNTRLSVRSSLSIFDRKVRVVDYDFNGTNYNLFTDLSAIRTSGDHTIIIGSNFIHDKFSEGSITSFSRDFTTSTAGFYAQHTWDLSQLVKMESGLRSDYIEYKNETYSNSEFFILPRMSILLTWSDQLSSRIGGGLGYKSPTLFTEETERIQYRDVLPLDGLTSEKSYGLTADIHYKSRIGEELFLTINQLFFASRITNSSILTQNVDGYYFENVTDPTVTQGFETNVRAILKDHFILYAGYTFTDAIGKYLATPQRLRLQPKHKVNLALIFEKEDDIKIGLEGYYTGNQLLSSGELTPSFWEFGLMTEKTFGKISIYVNAENFTDVRQSKYKGVVNGPHNAPTFDEIWNHTEGFVFSGGIKLKL